MKKTILEWIRMKIKRFNDQKSTSSVSAIQCNCEVVESNSLEKQF